ncbi:MAG: hypothetical protein OEV28_14110 [Nitrospirota bacterium]|nr:hypothetical protein [Nitrospirota bacterium]
MSDTSINRYLTPAAVALISGSLMLLELCYTRISSVILSYHYVFLVVSIAMLGLGLGGLVATRLKRPATEKIGADLGRWAALTSLAAAACFLPVALLPYIPAVIFYVLAAFLPFFLPESSSPVSSTC